MRMSCCWVVSSDVCFQDGGWQPHGHSDALGPLFQLYVYQRQALLVDAPVTCPTHGTHAQEESSPRKLHRDSIHRLLIPTHTQWTDLCTTYVLTWWAMGVAFRKWSGRRPREHTPGRCLTPYPFLAMSRSGGYPFQSHRQRDALSARTKIDNVRDPHSVAASPPAPALVHAPQDSLGYVCLSCMGCTPAECEPRGERADG